MPADVGNRKEDAEKEQTCGNSHATNKRLDLGSVSKFSMVISMHRPRPVNRGVTNFQPVIILFQSSSKTRVVGAAKYFLKASFWNLGIGEQWNRKCVKDFMPGQCLPYGLKMKESLSDH